MTNGQNQGDGMPGSGVTTSPADTDSPTTVISITWGRLCWTPPPDQSSGTPMKVTVTIETTAGPSDASSDPVVRIEKLANG
jgi:hypothetical protein